MEGLRASQIRMTPAEEFVLPAVSAVLISLIRALKKECTAHSAFGPIDYCSYQRVRESSLNPNTFLSSGANTATIQKPLPSPSPFPSVGSISA